MAATLASALTLPHLGRIVDRYSPMHVTFLVRLRWPSLQLLMSLSRSVALLLLTIYLLRLFGQGMMTHNALTATARWFAAQRGKAMSVVTQGINTGSAVFPISFVLVSGAIGWRETWLVWRPPRWFFVALPAISLLVSVDRAPRSLRSAVPKVVPDATGRARRSCAIRMFYLLLMGVMAPAFIGTSIFFHQVYLVHARGWSLEVFGSSFALMAVLTAGFALVCRTSHRQVSPPCGSCRDFWSRSASPARAGLIQRRMERLRLHDAARNFERFFVDAVRCALGRGLWQPQSRRHQGID